MRLVERWVKALGIGAVPPTIGLLAGWWGTFSFLPESGVAIASGAGFAAGLILDALYLGRWIQRAQDAPLWVWCAVYLVYSVGAFGFFMGVPVFNLLLALPAGMLLAGRMARARASGDQVDRTARSARAFATAVLAVACTASAAIAWHDPYTASNLEGMLGLPFEVKPWMIAALIVGGGAGLLAAQWWLSGAVVRWAHSRLSALPSPQTVGG